MTIDETNKKFNEEMTKEEKRKLIEDNFIEISLFDLWRETWYWMHKWGVPISDWHKHQLPSLGELRVWKEEPAKEELAEFLTKHCEHLKDDQIPEDIKPIVEKYMLDRVKM